MNCDITRLVCRRIVITDTRWIKFCVYRSRRQQHFHTEKTSRPLCWTGVTVRIHSILVVIQWATAVEWHTAPVLWSSRILNIACLREALMNHLWTLIHCCLKTNKSEVSGLFVAVVGECGSRIYRLKYIMPDATEWNLLSFFNARCTLYIERYCYVDVVCRSVTLKCHSQVELLRK